MFLGVLSSLARYNQLQGEMAREREEKLGSSKYTDLKKMTNRTFVTSINDKKNSETWMFTVTVPLFCNLFTCRLYEKYHFFIYKYI